MKPTVELLGRLALNDTLNLSGASLNDDDIEMVCGYLATHNNITTLNVSNNEITSVGAKYLLGIDTLKQLCVAGNKIDNKIIAELIQKSSLELLDVSAEDDKQNKSSCQQVRNKFGFHHRHEQNTEDEAFMCKMAEQRRNSPI